MITIAIPNFGDRISPRFEYAESMHLFSIENKKIVNKETIKLIVHSNLERINLIIGLKPDLIICDGISDLSYEKIVENNLRIIPWVNGTIEEILNKYLTGKLKESNRINLSKTKT